MATLKVKTYTSSYKMLASCIMPEELQKECTSVTVNMSVKNNYRLGQNTITQSIVCSFPKDLQALKTFCEETNLTLYSSDVSDDIFIEIDSKQQNLFNAGDTLPKECLADLIVKLVQVVGKVTEAGQPILFTRGIFLKVPML